MRATAFVVVCLMFLVMTALIASPPPASPSKIERGKYLVEQVGMCGDCHTPHGEKGEPVREKWLQGSPLAFKPTVPMPVWADKSPKHRRVAGLGGQGCSQVPDDRHCLQRSSRSSAHASVPFQSGGRDRDCRLLALPRAHHRSGARSYQLRLGTGSAFRSRSMFPSDVRPPLFFRYTESFHA